MKGNNIILSVCVCVRTKKRNEHSERRELMEHLLVTMMLPCSPPPPPARQPQTVIAPWLPGQGAFAPSTGTAPELGSLHDFGGKICSGKLSAATCVAVLLIRHVAVARGVAAGLAVAHMAAKRQEHGCLSLRHETLSANAGC